MTDLREAVRDVRNALVEPRKLCERLGIMKGGQGQHGGGVLICCPSHGERNPSCSVTRGPDGTVRVRCFACDFTADAIGLVALVLGLPTRGDGFRETLATAAELGGLLSLSSELMGGEPAPKRERPPPPEPEPEPEYPPADEVRALWDDAGRVSDDAEASEYLVGRKVDPELVAKLNLARVLGEGQALPRWARYRGESWQETGHRLVVRAFDAAGSLRSVRAARIRSGDTPKRLPPAGHRASGLVLANRTAVGMLLGKVLTRRVVIVEGEPDWLTWSTRTNEAVIGIGSGAWSQATADRIPDLANVCIRTHADDAGERYAAQVADTLGDRVSIWRAA